MSLVLPLSDQELILKGLGSLSVDTLERADNLIRYEEVKDPEQQEVAAQAFLRKYKGEPIICKTPEAIALENLGPLVWLKTLAPHVFRSEFAPFHEEYWSWIWPLLLAKRDGARLVSLDEPLSYLLTLGRGLAKSTCLEWTCIAFGALIGRCLILYVSSTGKLAISHLNNIRDEVEASAIAKYYPAMSEPEVGKHGNKYGWRGDLLSAKSGLTIFAIGLEEEVRGIKKREMRPAFIALDEFDGKGDSADVTAKKEGIIAGSIFGTQTPDTIIGMAQNLIGPQSVATRTWKRRNELLSYRRESGLIGAFTNDFKIEPDGTRWRATKGKPTWPGLDMLAFQKFLDTSGPIETEAEYQHVFDRNQEERVMHNYVDKIHVITDEDFEYVYKVPRPPSSWNKYMGNDKARTKTEYHANVAGTLTMSSQNTPLPGITFLYDPLSFEKNSEPDDCAIAMLKCIIPRVMYQGVNYEWEELRRILISRQGIDRLTGTLQERINAERSGLAQIIPKLIAPYLESLHYVGFRMSHEADDWRAVYRDTFGLPYEASNPGHGDGLALINMAMKIDYTVQDPFGRPARDDQGQIIFDEVTGKPVPLMGMSRWYMIVKKDKLPYPNDAKPDLLHGSDLARYQLTEHRNMAPKVNALGEMERDPEKRNDDFSNLLQFWYSTNSIQARELTPGERMEESLLPHQRQDAIDTEKDPERREKNVMSREIALRKQATVSLTKQLSGKGSGRGLSSYKKLAGRMK